MPFREIIGKSVGFGLVAAACIGGGLLAWYGPHAYNDYFNTVMAVALIVMGVGVAGLGVFLIAGIVLDARASAREHAVHVTPRPGPLAPPPPWGMGEVGRPPTGGDAGPRGGGSARVMSVAVSHLDAPLLVGVLVLWTIGFLIWLAPR